MDVQQKSNFRVANDNPDTIQHPKALSYWASDEKCDFKRDGVCEPRDRFVRGLSVLLLQSRRPIRHHGQGRRRRAGAARCRDEETLAVGGDIILKLVVRRAR